MKILLISLLICFNALFSIAQNKKYTDTYGFHWIACDKAEYYQDKPNGESIDYICDFKGKIFVETNPTKKVDFLVKKLDKMYFADIIVTTLNNNQIPVDCGDWIFTKNININI